MENFIVIPITNIREENTHTKTFYFAYPLISKPGQFVLLWLPGVGQKPFAVASNDGDNFSLTIVKRGPFTAKLFTATAGTLVGIAGPYGTSFTLNDNCRYIMAAGGYGVAPLYYLAAEAVKHETNSVDFCLGAKTATELLLQPQLKQLPRLKLHCATDDGSLGYHGKITELLSTLTTTDTKKTVVAACGPELMLKQVLQFCDEQNLPCQISLERYIKCGVGVCGQCAVDGNGLCMCKEGPVISHKIAQQITELGQYMHDAKGKKKYFSQE